MDHQLETHQSFLPGAPRHYRDEWPWCKGFIVKGVLYPSNVLDEVPKEKSEAPDRPGAAARTRIPLA